MGESGQGLGETTGHGEYGFGSNEWMMAFAIKSANSNPHLSRGRREKEKMMSDKERSNSDSSMASQSISSSNLQTPSSLKTPEMSPSILRLWRPQAQRNLRNQWSKLSSLRHDWMSSSSAGRSHATSLVNSYLSYRYMDAMDLGVLSDMPNIRKKACCKLVKQLELHQSQLLSAYKAMVAVVTGMMNSSRSMRCFLKATSGSPLIQFSSSLEDSNDTGDGGGVPVFTFLPIPAFEGLAEELVEMFKLELILKTNFIMEKLMT